MKNHLLTLPLCLAVTLPLAACSDDSPVVAAPTTAATTSSTTSSSSSSSSSSSTSETSTGGSSAAATASDDAAADRLPDAWPEPTLVGGKAVTKAPSGGFSVTTSKGTVVDDSMSPTPEDVDGIVDEIAIMHEGEGWSLNVGRAYDLTRDEAEAAVLGMCDDQGSAGGARRDNQTTTVGGDIAHGCEVADDINGQKSTVMGYAVAHEGHYYVIAIGGPFDRTTMATKRDAVLKGWVWGDQGAKPSNGV